jgi:hypothetical protein
MKSLRMLWLVASVAVGGCIVKEPAPYPLYPGGAPRSNDDVGVVVGPIAVVDGQEVASKGQTFALLPGCHSLRLLKTTGEVNTSAGGTYVAQLPQETMSIAIERGHYYFFEATLHEVGSPVMSGTIGFSDRDSDGAVTPAHRCRG